jgi:hypothetical protein
MFSGNSKEYKWQVWLWRLWEAGDEISLHEARSYKFILPLREPIVFDMLDYSVFDDVF